MSDSHIVTIDYDDDEVYNAPVDSRPLYGNFELYFPFVCVLVLFLISVLHLVYGFFTIFYSITFVNLFNLFLL